jgi:hypothetical protein
MAVDKTRLLVSLNSSKLQQQNNAAYQTIKGLIEGLQDTDRTVATMSSGGGSGGGSTPTTGDFDAAFQAALLVKDNGIKRLPESSGGSSGFEKELFLGGM